MSWRKDYFLTLNFTRLQRTVILLANIILVLAIGYQDHVTGWELGFFVFYFLPIAITAWTIGAASSCMIAVICALVWFGSDWFSAHQYSRSYYAFWNTSIRLLSFLIISCSVAKIRTLMIREKIMANKLEKSHDNLKSKLAERTIELEKIHSQLAMKDKMASVGQLAAGLAHELNNPMSFVATNFATLRDDVEAFKNIIMVYRDALEKGAVNNEHLRIIKEKENAIALDLTLEHMDKLFAESKDGIRRVTSIINSMRDFSRAYDPNEVCSFNINKGIQDMLVITRNTYKYHADVKTNFSKTPEIMCVPDMINQVFMNIVINAAQAIANQKRKGLGQIAITTYTNDNNVFCEISDDGPGVPDSIKDRIFDPFFTTKPPGQGTGLGLSICWDIITNKHGGSISIKDREGGGTVFVVRLPFLMTPKVSPDKTDGNSNVR